MEQMCKNLSPTKTRRGSCLVLPHTGYALARTKALPTLLCFRKFIYDMDHKEQNKN